MISESAAAGKPVYGLELARGNAKFAHFREAMRTAGTTRRFFGRIEPWFYSLPDDTARARGVPRPLVLGRRKRA
jgi:mitochondrial fission protein ELM1